MMKKIYISAWILLAAAALGTVLSGSFSPVALLVFSLFALALVHTLMLWSVVVNTRDFDSA
jgi:hypothetical protein